MTVFLLLVLFANILTNTATPHVVRRKPVETQDFRSLSERDFLDGGELLWSEPGYATNSNLDPMLFPESADPVSLLSDQVFAASCDGTQSSSLDPFIDLSGLDARGLIDGLSDKSDIDISLNEPEKPVCRSPTGQESGPGSGGEKDPKQNPEPLLAPLLLEDEQPGLEAGKCYVDGYIWALCCNGGTQGIFVYGCLLCE